MDKDEIVKNEILESAARLFQKWGYNKTTIEDIAKTAGKGKSSLYYYYKDKEQIFTEVVSREASAIFSAISERLKSCHTAEAKLKAYIETYLNEVEKSSNLYNIVFGEIMGNVSLLKRLDEQFSAMQAENVRKILEFGIKNGEFLLPENVDPTTVAYFIINAIDIVPLVGIFFAKGSNDQKSDVMSGVMSWMLLEGIKKREPQ